MAGGGNVERFYNNYNYYIYNINIIYIVKSLVSRILEMQMSKVSKL